MKMHQAFLTSPLDGGEWSASYPGCFPIPRKRVHGTHWTGGLVDHKTSQKMVMKRKIP